MSDQQSNAVKPAPASSEAKGAGVAIAEGVSAAEIDVSCRPVLLLLLSATIWLVAGSLFGLIASLKFHSPNILADCAWLTYGRVRPAANNALVYGAAIQAGLAILLWQVCQLGRTRLAAPALVVAGCVVWNLGMTVGFLGILAGDSTGFEWLEIPQYGAVLLFFGYLAMALAGFLSFRQRAEPALHISQWFFLAALFWFPWIYSTSELLLVVGPVRGVLQSVIAWWYANNLTTIWFGFVGLGTGFYFVSKLTERPLYSHYLGLFTFWMLAMFGSWGGVPTGAPVPSWLPALSSFGGILTIIPILAVALNIQQTTCARPPKNMSTSLKFILFGMLAYVVAGVMGCAASIPQVSEITNFTWYIPAQSELMVYGFFAMVMFGATYYVVPRLTQLELSESLTKWHFRLSAAGIVIFVVPLAIGGIWQGFAMKDASKAFLDVMKGTLMFLRISTPLSDLLLLGGGVLLLVNLAGLVVRMGKACYSATLTHVKAVEVAA
jgi:cytochrome c oxidase cbb3-type subunit I